MRSHIGSILLICTTALVWSSCSPQKVKTDRMRVQVAVPSSPIPYLPVYLAHELGYDHEQGIELVTEDVPGGSKALQAMFGGSVEIAAGFYELAMQMAAEGRRVQSFLILLDRPGFVLAVSPASTQRIHEPKKLRGAVLGVSTPGSASHNFVNDLLLRHGVPLKDVSITAVGLGASAGAAIERGHVDAAVLTGSAITVLQRRFPKLTVLADTRTAEGVRMLLGNDVYPAYGLLATADWLQKNPTTARDVASAVNKATAWMREHSPEEIRARMPARYRSADAEADLEALRAAIPMLSSDGKISTNSAETVRQALALSVDKVRTLPIDLSQTYTNESIRAR